MNFQFKKLQIPGAILIAPPKYRDDRGSFTRTYERSLFENEGITCRFRQDCSSISGRNVVRGLHYQLRPKTQEKLIQCVRGRVWDVAVDIRRRSPTYGQWFSVDLSEENGTILYLPEGFAHGFVALTETAEMLYKLSQEYDPGLERRIAWNDPDIGIAWPVTEVSLSDKDRTAPRLKEAEINFE